MERDGSPPGGRLRSDPRRGMVLGLLGLAFMLPLLDGTIVCVAMPSIQSDLGFHAGGIHWVMTAYLLSFGGFLPLGIRLCDLLGSRRMFLVGIAVFTAGSLVSGVAWSPGVLVAGRALQGIGAAVLAPTTLPLLVAHFDVASGRGRALALWSFIGASAGTAGYLVGGPLVAGPGWQWIFLVNVPVGAGMLALGPVLLHDGENLGRRCRHPLVPLRLLASRTRLCGILLLLAGGVVAEGSPFLLTLYVQQVLGSSPATFGVLMTIMTVSAVVGSFVGQVVAVRRGVRLPAVLATVLVVAGCLRLTAVSVNGSFMTDVFLGILLLGPGLGAMFVCGQIAVVAGAPLRDSIRASGMADATFSIGGALGLAALSSVVVAYGPWVLGDAIGGSVQAELAPGLRQGFAVAACVMVLGLVGALALPRDPLNS